MKTTMNLRLAQLPDPDTLPLTPTERNLDLLNRALALLGWKPGYPIGAEKIAQVDAELVAETRCQGSRRKTLRFYSWHRPPQAYLAASVCNNPTCGQVEEV
jgi:hypothetical protein